MSTGDGVLSPQREAPHFSREFPVFRRSRPLSAVPSLLSLQHIRLAAPLPARCHVSQDDRRDVEEFQHSACFGNNSFHTRSENCGRVDDQRIRQRTGIHFISAACDNDNGKFKALARMDSHNSYNIGIFGNARGRVNAALAVSCTG